MRSPRSHVSTAAKTEVLAGDGVQLGAENLEPEVGEQDGEVWRAPVRLRGVNVPEIGTSSRRLCRGRENRDPRLIAGHVSPGLHDYRLIRDVAVVSAAALHDTGGFPAVVLFREADIMSRREQRATRRQKEDDEHSDSR